MAHIHLTLTSPIDCLCDFTYNFFWQHEGTELDPDAVILHQLDTYHTYRQLVDELASGRNVHILGSVGKRFASSLGVDIAYFGGSGKSICAGSVFVDGDIDTRCGISMVAGAIYVSGKMAKPMGNMVEVASDTVGYKKYISITELLHNMAVDHGSGGAGDADSRVVMFADDRNSFDGTTLVLGDKIMRDTVAARLDVDATVIVRGDVSLSTGILMRKGKVIVEGDAGMNTGVLLNGGRVVVMGDTAEFAGAEMRHGELIIGGKVHGYIGANMKEKEKGKGGSIYVKGNSGAKPIPPAKVGVVDDVGMLQKELGIGRMEAMMYTRIGL